MIDLSDITAAVRQFAEERTEIVAAYVFGSALTRRNPEDLDIAFIVQKDAGSGTEYPYGYHAHLVADLMKALHRNDIDVVILNDASPLLCIQVLKNGNLVYNRNEQERIQLEKRMRDRYLDTAPLRRIKEYYLKQRYLDDGE